ncbi:MAG TPA: HAD hydrolase-like protein, partial [Tepidisphaeraceae bacterium]|nr:HAD hydrolase-like protein [Tepidisphaeraceae bacterium]
IGDAPRDIEAGKAAGCRTILFQDPTLPASPAASATPLVLPDHYVQSLKDAMDIIERADVQAHAPPVVMSSPVAPLPPAIDLQRLESLSEQILQELRKPAPAPAVQTSPPPPAAEPHFSFSKMMAGVVQVLAVAVFALAYRGGNVEQMLVGLMLQLLTIALLIMGRQK